MVRVTLDQLRRVPLLEDPTESWRPIQHIKVVDAIHATLRRNRKHVVSEQFYLYSNTTLLYAFIHTDWKLNTYCKVSFILRTSNDRARGLNLIAAVRPNNTNTLLAHTETAQIARRHTPNFNLERETYLMFDLATIYTERLAYTLKMLKRTRLTADVKHELFYKVFSTGVLSTGDYTQTVNNLPDMIRAYGNTQWALYNTFSATAMRLRAQGRYKALVKLGAFFGVYKY